MKIILKTKEQQHDIKCKENSEKKIREQLSVTTRNKTISVVIIENNTVDWLGKLPYKETELLNFLQSHVRGVLEYVCANYFSNFIEFADKLKVKIQTGCHRFTEIEGEGGGRLLELGQ